MDQTSLEPPVNTKFIFLSGKESKKTIDHSFLACSHHSVMVGAFGFVDDSAKCLIVGLGGGALPSFIQTHLKNVSFVENIRTFQ